MKQLKRRMVSYLSGILGFFWLSGGFFDLLWEEISYEGGRGVLWSFLLCCVLWMLVWTRACGILYLISAVMVCASPFLNISLAWSAVCLLFISFVSLYTWDKHRALAVTAGILTVLFALGGLFGYGQEKALTEFTFLVDRYAGRIYRAVNGESGENLFENGSVNRGNNYRSGGVQLDILLDQQPRDTIYLRGFIGEDYIGSRWTEADETSLYRRMRDRFPIAQSEAGVQRIYNILYFIMNHATSIEWRHLLIWGKLSEDETAARMILHPANEHSREYVPYFSFSSDESEQYGTGKELQRKVYTFYYYELSDMNEDDIEQNSDNYPEMVKQFREEYAEYANENYLNVSEDLVPRLAKLCETHPFAEPEEMTAFIKETLQADTSYTRTPGTTPINQDVIEYFLFESKRGYCMHYASAATLMYRLYGIPARYVTGYVVYPEDFTEQEDGTYAAAVTDYRKHAWVEIYQENLGWVPIEMTPLIPSGNGVAIPNWLLADYFVSIEAGSAAVTTAANLNEEEEEEEREYSGAEVNEEEEEEEDEGYEGDEGEEAEIVENEIQRRIFLKLPLYGIAGLVILTAAILCLRRKIQMAKLPQMDVRRLFYRLIKILRLNKEFKGYWGTEEDFPGKLYRAIPVLNAGEAEAIIKIVSGAAYGQSLSVSEEDREKVYALYRIVVKAVYGRMKPAKRFYCKWILNLC